MHALTCLLAILLFAAPSMPAGSVPAAAAAATETLAADTPRTTVAGNKFIAPAGWTIEVRGPATILEPPEGGSRIALVDVKAKDADAAVAAAWAAYRPEAKWPLKVTHDFPDRDGWSDVRDYSYQTSPNEKPAYVENGRQKLGVPGVSVGIVQDGKVVFAGGFGVRRIGSAEKPDADTLYLVASNTKGLTTLLLAKLLDEGKLTWETPVTKLLPSFRLGDPATTSRVLVKHLICACTGLPRQDFEWLLEYGGLTCEGALKTLATMKPTSEFGALFQYSNPLAAAGGFVGGHVAYPSLELGAAYDEAMRTRVFQPLGMTATTLDFARALASNHATAHAPDLDGKPALAVMDINYAVIPVRPAGGAWSSARDMLKYVQMELEEGKLPDGTRYVSREALLARREPQVSIGQDTTYGMGLMVDTKYGIPVVHHGGDMIGYHSDMIWLPEHGVGAVILTNADPGWVLRGAFRRKLLEVLFDGRPEADADVAAQAKSYFDQLAAERKLFTVPAPAEDAGKLAARYTNDALGEIAVRRSGGRPPSSTSASGRARSPRAATRTGRSRSSPRRRASSASSSWWARGRGRA
jgi:CubicO group peptidase (beta-lactamase class C family)